MSNIKESKKISSFINKFVSVNGVSSKNRLQKAIQNFPRISYVVLRMYILRTVHYESKILTVNNNIEHGAKIIRVFGIKEGRILLPTHEVIMWTPDGDFAIDFSIFGGASGKTVLADTSLVIFFF